MIFPSAATHYQGMNEHQDEDVHERPTLPGPYGSALAEAFFPEPRERRTTLRFETPVEQFFVSGQRAIESAVSAMIEEDAAAWWAAQRRRAHASWVAGILALCVAVLVLGALR